MRISHPPPFESKAGISPFTDIVPDCVGEILKLEKDGEGIIFDQKAEDAIVRLLEIQKEVDGAIEYLKSEIERQALHIMREYGLKLETALLITYTVVQGHQKLIIAMDMGYLI